MPQDNILLFLGPSTLSPFGDGAVRTITQGNSFESIGHVDNVILYGHGGVEARNTEQESHEIQLMTRPDIFKDGSSTIKEVFKIMEATTPQHIDLVSCFGGALGEDIQKKENFDQLVALMQKNNQTDLTISVFASSKHPTFTFVGEPYMRAVASLESSTDPGIQRVGLMRNLPETLKQYRIHIDDSGQASLVGFKIRSPKTANDIDHPEQFIGSHTLYGDKVDDKVQRKTAQIVTEIGQDDPRHDKLLHKIQEELRKDGAQYSQEYIKLAASLSVLREKPELIKKWISTLPDDSAKTSAMSMILRTPANLHNSELVRAIVEAAPAKEQPCTWERLMLRKDVQQNHKVAEAILNVMTPHEKVELLSYVLHNQEVNQDIRAQHLSTLLYYINVNTTDDNGNTILHKAMQYGYDDTSYILGPALERRNALNKIDCTIKNNAGQTLLDMAYTESQRELQCVIMSNIGVVNGFKTAMKISDIETIQRFIMAGYNVNSKDDLGEPMIFHAIDSKNIPIIKLLLSANADVLAKRYTRTALDAAESTDDPKIFQLVKEAVEDRRKIPLSKVKKLDLACQIHDNVLKHDVEKVQSLIKTNSGDVNATNFYHDPLLNVATRLGDVKMVKALLEVASSRI